MRPISTKALSLKENTLWNSFGSLFYLGCQWITTVLVVVLSPNYANSGILAFAMATGVIFTSIALYSIRTYQVSDLDDEYSSQNYIAFRLITIIGAAGLCFCYLLVITEDMTFIFASLVYLLFKADESFVDVIYGIEQKNMRMDYIGKSQIIRGIVTLIGFVAPLALTDNLFFAIIVMAVCGFLVTLFYDLPHARAFGGVRPAITYSKGFRLAKTCFPAMLATVFACAITTIARQYFGVSHGEELLGIYAAIATPAILIQVVANYLYSPWIGELAKANLKKDRSFIKLFIKITITLTTALTLLVLVMIPVGEWLLALVYGESILNYLYIFPFVMIATGCVGVLFFMNNVLIILRNFAVLLLANTLGFLATLISAYSVMAVFGIDGVNYTIILGCVVAIIIDCIGIIVSKIKR